MDASSPRFKSVAVTAGLSFWFFIITQSIGIFSIEILIAFSISLLTITQIFTKKLSKGLDIFAISWNIIWYNNFYLWNIF